VRRWQAEQLGGTSLVKNPNVAADDRTASLLDGMENGLASVAGGRDKPWAG
jgi:hypothetical protein